MMNLLIYSQSQSPLRLTTRLEKFNKHSQA